uniref:Homeobox-DDT domain protein RLT2 isoform X4 n=1 Tax=Cicer arietinum TaxID=3827 RepID=A0A3Q7XU58_CICAR|nr:homeobox-DDT domain protein RLT2 isoform X4 [Cicer arietinum]
MENCSEVEKKKKPPEEENKVKRKMKTASQLEILEKAYAAEPYPSEEFRVELCVKLGLSDRQLQMWFCHRRLKDRKAVKTAASISAPTVEGVEQIEIADVRHDHGLVSVLKLIDHDDLRRVVPQHGMMAYPRMGAGLHAMDSSSSFHEPQLTILELRAIAFVERQLGEALREDGPILGMEFDSLPPGAFGAPLVCTPQGLISEQILKGFWPKRRGPKGVVSIGQHRESELPVEAKVYEHLNKGVSRTLHEYQFIPEQPTVRNEMYARVTTSIHFSSLDGVPHSGTTLSSGQSFLNGNEFAPNVYGVQGGNDDVPRKNPFVDVTLDTHRVADQVTPIDSPLVPSDRRVIHEEELSRFQRKRKNEEARMQREFEAQEKRIRKELVKQDILRQKREEQIKKEMERQERERKKEEERLLRERQREEERFLREQRREQEQREKFLQKESIRVERLRQKEELRREKEAARIKASSERAIARRMAKESIDLIEDEHLELMELAASKKGLSSILALDYETMQNLESYGDGRTSFPPKSVRLKKAFSIQPWSDSDENVGNLLMVWRFLITFADVLGIWPFTLDELLQAFHDYDPRILGEIHIALLRSILKDIEDVARTPTTGLGANQNNITNSGGGHPQVVEGAYVWGFDIRNWQWHLNPLTWPEILRQFALSAGFGPLMKKQNIEQVHPCNEGNDGKDIISNLRSGAAVENAVAIMQEKGLPNRRTYRPRLTPGTVKYAAFHVLSLEGSRGLNILELADKIQKSGLRDLTTSKAPEASIASALSRDTKLFERTAPSTYCVRPAYRKDPADSEAIYSAAREKIRVFKSGFVGAEEADDGERDENSESDMAENHEIDDLGAETNTKKEVSNSEKFNANTVMRNGKDNGEGFQTPDSCHEKVDEGLASTVDEGFNKHKDVHTSSEIAVCSHDVTNPILEGMDVDENTLGEPWAQGLMEGEYSDLSVEERLHALVALINVAIEGNSIRLILEERLEAANTLKKQIWAEAQLDKRRIKDDCFVKLQSFSYLGNKNEPAVTFPSVEGKQCPLHTVHVKIDKASVTPYDQHEQINALQGNQNHLQSSLLDVNIQRQDCPTGPDNCSLQQSGYVAEKSRSNFKSYIGHLAEQTYMYRSLPLGLDRRRNRYWQFITSASQNDPGCGRIFVELHDGCWKLIDSEEGFDALLASLDLRGIRESHLHMMLQRIEMSYKNSVRRNVQNGDMGIQNGDTMKKLKTETVKMGTDQDCSATSVYVDDLDTSVTSTSFMVQLGRNEVENKDAYMRYWDFEKWMQKQCLNCSVSFAMKFGKKRCNQLLLMCDLCHRVYFSRGTPSPCPSCHRTSTSQDNSSSYECIARSEGKRKIGTHLFNHPSSSPFRMRLLKILLSVVEVTLPQEALQPFWTERYRKSWSSKLEASSSPEDILQTLTALEGAIKREYLAPDYETTSELLGTVCSSGCLPNDTIGGGQIPVLPWVPYTTAAVALRLMELDACIFYTSQQKLESEKDKKNGVVIKLPSKYAAAKNSYNASVIETSFQAKHAVENLGALGAGLESYSRGQRTRLGRGHSHGQRSQGRVSSSRPTSRKRSTTSNNRKIGKLLGWKGRPNGQGQFCGRRSIRSWQKPAAKTDVLNSKRDTRNVIKEKTPIFVREEINESKTEASALNARNSETSDNEEDLYQATGDEYDYLVGNNNNGGYQGGFCGKSDNLIEQSHYILDDEEDGDMDNDDNVNDDKEDGQVDLNVEDYIIGEDSKDAGYNREIIAEQNEEPDGVFSTSSDYID